MKKYIFITTLLTISSLLLSGCMTTWPIVDDLDHYKKWNTYESIRDKNEETTITGEDIEEVEESLESEINNTDNIGIAENDEKEMSEEVVVQE